MNNITGKILALAALIGGAILAITFKLGDNTGSPWWFPKEQEEQHQFEKQPASLKNSQYRTSSLIPIRTPSNRSDNPAQIR